MKDVALRMPKPFNQVEGHVDVGDGHQIWYFDTGGEGNPIVMLHADTGSGVAWGYQQPVFSAAGYRVIGYSRRGRQRSIMGDPEKPGIGSQDLLRLVDHLKLDRFHLLGTAAGGMIATDFTISHERRLLSLVLANTIVGITNEDYEAIYRLIWPDAFESLPADFRELSPSYRHLNVEGRRLWNKIERQARIGGMRRQAFANKVAWEHLALWKLPVLLLTGDADLYTPPSMMRLVASRIRSAESLLIPECGHSGYWERPDIFNRVVLEFFARHDCA